MPPPLPPGPFMSTKVIATSPTVVLSSFVYCFHSSDGTLTPAYIRPQRMTFSARSPIWPSAG